MKSGHDCCKLPLRNREEEEVAASIAAATEISLDDAVAEEVYCFPPDLLCFVKCNGALQLATGRWRKPIVVVNFEL